ncbi:MAG TPA: HupE/UreJ family protein [Burkholderiales bacterium]|nr:HupE/UreJ family protein [Burkholderiales bacterium]
MRVHAFVEAERGVLHMVVRLPLALLLNLNLPKRGPGYVDLAQVDAVLPAVLGAIDKDIELFEDGRRLSPGKATARISEASDRSFETYERAVALVRGPRLPESAEVFWNQGYLDAHLQYAIRSPHSAFSIDFHPSPGLREKLKLDLRYATPDGAVRAFDISTGSGEVTLDPRWHQAAWSFVKSGLEHILDGPDHLLFLLCLVVPFRRIDWNLIWVVTSFTVAHSITLIAAAYGFVPSGAWFPPFVEVLIAASILYMAIENVVRPHLARRWVLSGLFGLVHGFAFSFLLQTQLQFAGSHLLLSLLAFNVGIELGQLVVLFVVLPILGLIYRAQVVPDRLFVAIVSLVVGHTAWHWLTERLETLRKTGWPPESVPVEPLAALLLVTLGLVLLWRAAKVRRTEVADSKRASP